MIQIVGLRALAVGLIGSFLPMGLGSLALNMSICRSLGQTIALASFDQCQGC